MRRKLCVWRESALGKATDQIAMELGISRERVRVIRNEVAGWSSEKIWELAFPKPPESYWIPKKTSKRPGRSGHSRVRGYLESLNTEDEPLFEMKLLLLSARLKVACIALRRGRERDLLGEDDGERYEQENADDIRRWRKLRHLEDILKEIKNPRKEALLWTRTAMVDAYLQAAFKDLREGSSKVGEVTQEARVCLSSLGEANDKEFYYLVIVQGDLAKERALLKKSVHETTHRQIELKPTDDFIGYLEGVLYQRRIRHGGVGFMPTAPLLCSKARDWSRTGQRECFIWMLEMSRADQVMRWGLAQRYYLAFEGVISDMSGHLRKQICHKESFKLFQIPVETKLQAPIGAERDKHKLNLTPLPGYTYAVRVKESASNPDFIKKCREKVKAPNVRAVFYSARKTSDLRETPRLESGYFNTNDRGSRFEGSRVVLFPRYFLTHPPAWDCIKRLGERYDSIVDGVSRQEEMLILKAPYIWDEIRSLWSSGFYQKRIKRLHEWNEHINHIVGPSLGLSGVEEKIRPLALYGDDYTDFLLKDGSKNLYLTDIQDIHTNLTWSAYDKMNRTMRNDGVIKEFLRQVDCDFILSEFRDKAWALLERDAGLWGQQVGEIIADACYEKGKPKAGLTRLFSTKARENLTYKRMIYILDDVVGEAMKAFCSDRRFVQRLLMEQMQRRVLLGLAPRPIAFDSVTSITGRCMELIKKILRGYCRPDNKEVQRGNDFLDSKPTDSTKTPRFGDDGHEDHEDD